jgi:hypothetical protein
MWEERQGSRLFIDSSCKIEILLDKLNDGGRRRRK